MTEEKAIEVLKIMKSQMKDFGVTATSDGIRALQEKTVDVSVKALNEIQQYRKIGTVDELQDLKDLRIPIAARKVLLMHGMGYECPNCGNELEVNAINGMYCYWCGQRLLWREDE